MPKELREDLDEYIVGLKDIRHNKKNSENMDTFLGNIQRGLELLRAGSVIADTARSVIGTFKKEKKGN